MYRRDSSDIYYLPKARISWTKKSFESEACSNQPLTFFAQPYGIFGATDESTLKLYEFETLENNFVDGDEDRSIENDAKATGTFPEAIQTVNVSLDGKYFTVITSSKLYLFDIGVCLQSQFTETNSLANYAVVATAENFQAIWGRNNAKQNILTLLMNEQIVLLNPDGKSFVTTTESNVKTLSVVSGKVTKYYVLLGKGKSIVVKSASDLKTIVELNVVQVDDVANFGTLKIIIPSFDNCNTYIDNFIFMPFTEIHHLHLLDDHNLIVGYKNNDLSQEPSLGSVSFTSLEASANLKLIDLKDVVCNPTDDFFEKFQSHKYFTSYIPERYSSLLSLVSRFYPLNYISFPTVKHCLYLVIFLRNVGQFL